MKTLLFGTAGVPKSTKGKSTIDGIKRIKGLGLDCMELEWVRGVHLSEEKAGIIKKTAGESGITLTAHAPYYINLNSSDKSKRKASVERILKTARIGSMCGALSITFHAAYYQNGDHKEVYQVVKRYLNSISGTLAREGINLTIRPETTGKKTQFGSLDECINLSSEIERVLPCIDFSHLYAREVGEINSFDDFSRILESLKSGLGSDALKNMHIHISGIEYTKKGEKKHLNLAESNFKFMDLLRAFHEFDIRGIVICESPNLEEDALLLKKKYENIK